MMVSEFTQFFVCDDADCPSRDSHLLPGGEIDGDDLDWTGAREKDSFLGLTLTPTCCPECFGDTLRLSRTREKTEDEIRDEQEDLYRSMS